MPFHDWQKAPTWLFDDFRFAWLVHIKEALNVILPPSEYAQVERHTRKTILDGARKQALRAGNVVVVIRRTIGHHLVSLVEIVPPQAPHWKLGWLLYWAKTWGFSASDCFYLSIQIRPDMDSRDRDGRQASWAETPIVFSLQSRDPPTITSGPLQIGLELQPMDLCLGHEARVTIPLESTYNLAFGGIGASWRAQLMACATDE